MDPFERKIPLNKRERRKNLGQSTREVARVRERGVPRSYYYKDSELQAREGTSEIHDYSYDATFSRVLPSGTDLETYILQYVMPQVATKGMIFMDMGGPGRRLAANMRELGTRPTNELSFGVRRSLGVTLQDYEPEQHEEFDATYRHTVLEGNLLTEKIDKDIDAWLGQDKIDLSFERLGGGMEALPLDPYWIAKKLQRSYKRHADGGAMFLQAPARMNRFLNEWVLLLKEKYPDTLEVSHHMGTNDGNIDLQSVLLIRKLPGAPAELPFLDARTVRRLSLESNAFLERKNGLKQRKESE